MAGNSPYASPYGSATTTTSKKNWLKGLFGKKTTSASAFSSYGGLSSSPYGASGSSYGASMGLRGGATGTSPYGSTLGGGGLGGGLGSGTAGSYGAGSSYGSSLGGASSYGSSSLGGSPMGFGSTSLSGGGGGTGKATADLADSNPSSVMTVDPSIHFYDYGGSTSFGGQIETVQAPDSPGMVTQVLSQPGQNKVLVIDGGGQMNSAILDGQAASTAMRNGWKGIIVYGAVRNAATLQGLSIGVKALGTNPRKGSGSMGQRGGAVNISNAQFQSGWWVFADKDGIIISQTDISGQGGYGSSGSSLGGTSSFGGTGTSSFGASSMGGTSSFGGTSSYGAGSSLGGSSYGSGSTMGGMGGSSSLGGSSYGAGGSSYGAGSSLGGTSSYGAGSLGGSTLGGGSSLYGSTGYGSTGGLGSYGSSYSTGGYGSGGYGSSLYGNSYAAKKKKNKVFKILLASSIAAIVWIVCLR